MDEEIFYHYTSVQAAFAIITSRKLRLTDYRYLNDRREFEHGYQIFLSKLRDDLKLPFERAMLWHNFQSHHCVMSFSKSPKILSQWRAYASDGEGLALGFRKTSLTYQNFIFLECKYENIDEYVLKIVQKHSEFLESVKVAREIHTGENSFMDWIRENKKGFYDIVKDLILIKNPAFI